MRCLLDVNVLIALAFPAHVSHRAAHAWFRQVPRRLWATCPLTQAGFLRLAARLLGGTREALQTAFSLLEANCQSPDHEFWAMPGDLRAVSEGQRSRLTRPNQITDLQLLLLAHHQKGLLVTLDAGLPALAAATRQEHSVLLLRAQA